MLEKLDDIDWGSLEHAYGGAADVPDLIRALTSQDEKEFDSALWNLYGNIFHQGTRYEASAPAVPFIYELIQEPSVMKKHELISYLVSLALGYENGYLPWGPNVSVWKKQYEEKLLPKSESFFTPLHDDYTYLKWEIDVYDAVQEGVPILIKLLESEDDIIRYYSTYALAWFRESAKESAPEVRKLLDTESDPYFFANAIISLGLLDFYNEDKSDLQTFVDIMEGDYPMISREAAAIARATASPKDIPDEVFEFLFDGLVFETYLRKILDDKKQEYTKDPLEEIKKLSQPDERSKEGMKKTFDNIRSYLNTDLDRFLLWNEGDLSGYITDILSSFQGEKILKNLPVVCEAYLSVKGMAAQNLAASMLRMAFPRGYKKLPEDAESEGLLTKDQQKVVATLFLSDAFMWSFVNFTQMVRSYGIPDSKMDILKFLQEKGSLDIYKELFTEILEKREFFWNTVNSHGWHIVLAYQETLKYMEETNETLDQVKTRISRQVTIDLSLSKLFGNILIDFGKAQNIEQIECFGKDLVASSLAYSENIDDLKLAIKLFEEAKAVSEEYYSPTIYQDTLKKLADIEPTN